MKIDLRMKKYWTKMMMKVVTMGVRHRAYDAAFDVPFPFLNFSPNFSPKNRHWTGYCRLHHQDLEMLYCSSVTSKSFCQMLGTRR